MEALRNQIYELIVEQRRVEPQHALKLSDLQDNSQLTFDTARRCLSSSDAKLKKAAQVLIGLLFDRGIQSGVDGVPVSRAILESQDSGERPSSVVAQRQAAPVSAAPEQRVNAAPVRTFSSEWQRLEELAIDEGGPIAAKRIRRLREENPGVDPGSLGKECAVLMPSIAHALYQRYHQSRR